jgi:hypothetical protein
MDPGPEDPGLVTPHALMETGSQKGGHGLLIPHDLVHNHCCQKVLGKL